MAGPKVLLLAVLGGAIPSLLWLWFWLKEDDVHPEPRGLLAIVFIMGMIAVVIVFPIQKFIRAHVDSSNLELILWAASEELLKYLAVLILLRKTNNVEEPIDWPMYLITSALGFAMLENTLYLIKPLTLSGATVSLLTGQLRFLGSTLLHAIASETIGMALGVSFFMHKGEKKLEFLNLSAAGTAE